MQPSDFASFIDNHFTGVHIYQHVRMIPVRAASPSLEIHCQEEVRIVQCLDSVCHFFCLIINLILRTKITLFGRNQLAYFCCF